MSEAPKKVVLAYSGGLDTSVILRWLQQTYGCEVVTFTADIGQGEELEPARAKAEALGVRDIRIEDLRETFVRDYVFPMFRANAIYEGVYLLGTSIARPAHRQAPDRDRARDWRRCRGPRRNRQGQRSGALRARLLRARARHPGHRTLARVGHRIAGGAGRLRGAAPDPDPAGQAWRAPLLHRRQPSAHLLRGEGAGRPVGRGPTRACSPARSLRKLRRTGRPQSRSSSRPAIRWPWTAKR